MTLLFKSPSIHLRPILIPQSSNHDQTFWLSKIFFTLSYNLTVMFWQRGGELLHQVHTVPLYEEVVEGGKEVGWEVGGGREEKEDLLFSRCIRLRFFFWAKLITKWPHPQDRHILTVVWEAAPNNPRQEYFNEVSLSYPFIHLLSLPFTGIMQMMGCRKE